MNPFSVALRFGMERRFRADQTAPPVRRPFRPDSPGRVNSRLRRSVNGRRCQPTPRRQKQPFHGRVGSGQGQICTTVFHLRACSQINQVEGKDRN